MLKITMVDIPAEQRLALVLEGRLAQDGLPELELAWERVRRAHASCSYVIDLRSVTFIDGSAERLLLEINRQGAQFLASGVANIYRLEQLGIRCRARIECQSVGSAPAR